MAKPIFQLVRKHGAIASQDIHLGRSLYSLPFPIKAKDTLIINTKKSSYQNSIKPNIPMFMDSLGVFIPFTMSNSTVSSKKEFNENYSLPLQLTSIGTNIPFTMSVSTISSKLEATVSEIKPYLSSVSIGIPFTMSSSTITSHLSVITHKQKIEMVELNTAKSSYEVK